MSRKSAPETVKRAEDGSGSGMVGKSSYGTVFAMLFAVPDEIVTVSPTCSNETTPVPENERAMSLSICAGSATTPGDRMVPRRVLSMPVSRFVARSFIPSSPAIIIIADRTGRVAVRRSENRAVVFTASANSFLSKVIFIGSLCIYIIQIDACMMRRVDKGKSRLCPVYTTLSHYYFFRKVWRANEQCVGVFSTIFVMSGKRRTTGHALRPKPTGSRAFYPHSYQQAPDVLDLSRKFGIHNDFTLDLLA